MSNFDLLAKLGVFVRPNFLEPELAAQVVASSEAAPVDWLGTVDDDGVVRQVDEVSQLKVMNSPAPLRTLITERLDAARPQLEDFFKLSLGRQNTQKFISYRAGDFIRPHRDQLPETRPGEITTIIFLNNENNEVEAPDGDGYVGGALFLYGLIQKEGWQDYGFQIRGETGLLVAFPAHTIHEVTPVIEGTRFTFVTQLGIDIRDESTQTASSQAVTTPA